ncbi:MAG: zf-TFIIB domain-containing protein [Deltaproteobacteria bacterium]|nr:zf-TFIIB domain-containing protein [Deltaproteobacteria bacterium]
MRCPKCREETLQPTGTPLGVSTVHHCSACQGLWFALGDFDALAPPEGVPLETDAEADGKAGLCPAGHGLLQHEQVPEAGFFLDRCGLCGGTWFDRGEWERLSAQGLLGLLDGLWTPSARRMERAASLARAGRQRLAERLGEEVLHRIDALIEALKEHPHRAQALAYLMERLR